MNKTLGLYVLLVSAQTLGEIAILSAAIPVYRRLVNGEVYGPGGPPIEVAVPLLVGVGIIQAAYWTRRIRLPELPLGKHIVLGHLVLFLGRLNFLLVSGLFALAFIVRYDVVHFSPTNLALFFAVLFSVFCYTLELERLGRAWGT